MNQLPAEVILHIILFLDPRDIVRLQLVSKRIYVISRDQTIWKSICFDRSFFTISHRRQALFSEPRPPTETELIAQQIRAAAQLRTPPPEPEDVAHQNVKSVKPVEAAPSANFERIRGLANWDPSYPTEKVDWYGEYIARHAPLSVSWLQQPVSTAAGEDSQERCEVKGIGYHTDSTGSRVVAPLDNGSVCVWNISHDSTSRKRRRGSILACSRPDLLSVNGESNSFWDSPYSKAKMTSTGVVECVSVDSIRNKVYFAVQSGLNELDLETLQVSAHERYPFSISALSPTDYPIPLTIGTTLSLHLHDPRRSRNTSSSSSDYSERIETVADFPVSPRLRNDFHRLQSGDQTIGYASLFQPGPISILHLSSHPTGVHDASTGEIYVAGRFPSVLIYDRRCFPKLQNTIHSGARLCSLTSLPYSFKSLEVDLMRRNQLSLSQISEFKSQPGNTLIACGEYNSKGSLEMFGLAPSSEENSWPHGQQAGASQISTYKNRVTASSSKLLSVATHGTRLVVSDGDGGVKWIERDGSTLVRKWNINAYNDALPPAIPSGIFSSSSFTTTGGPSTGDVVRKILPTAPAFPQTSPEQSFSSPITNSDELLVWTGERIGVLAFKKYPMWSVEDWEERRELGEMEQRRRREEDIYGETIKRALERQADEVRFLNGLGLGGRQFY
ncbi:MAG: hypothetical protein MMC33_000209 [Icmadophila ericetorum]|nr:hypothetical protein [Icmadophila ericetorum]